MTIRQEWIHRLRYLMGFLRSDFRSTIQPSLYNRIRMLRRGFLGESYILYGLDRNDPGQYLPDYARFLCQQLNAPFNALLRDKLAFTVCFQPYMPLPETYAIVKRGRVAPFNSGGSLSTVDELIEEVSNGRGLVLKPIRGLQGRGILILRSQDGRFTVNEEPTTREALKQRLGQLDDVLVTELVEQDDYAAEIFPRTINTLRVYTLIDPATEQPFVPMAAQRIGTEKTVPVDNWSKGGLATTVDVDHGTLGKACGFPEDGEIKWHSRHPDTGAVIDGRQVSRWATVRKQIVEAAARFPFLKFVGWDIVVTRKNYVVLEGNSPGFNLIQMHQPLLANERFKRCLEQYGIISHSRARRTRRG